MQESSKIREAATSLQVIMSAAAPTRGFTDTLRGFFSSRKSIPLPGDTLATILATMIQEMLADKAIVNIPAFIKGLDKNYTNWLKLHTEVTQKMHPSLTKYKNLQDNAQRFEQLIREIKEEQLSTAVVVAPEPPAENAANSWFDDLTELPHVDSAPQREALVSAELVDLPQLPVVDIAPIHQAEAINPAADDEYIPTAIGEVGEEDKNYHITDSSWREIDEIIYDPETAVSMLSGHVTLLKTLKGLRLESEDDEEQIEDTLIPESPVTAKTASPKVDWLAGWLSSPVLAISPTESAVPNGMKDIFRKMREKDLEKNKEPTLPNSNIPK